MRGAREGKKLSLGLSFLVGKPELGGVFAEPTLASLLPDSMSELARSRFRGKQLGDPAIASDAWRSSRGLGRRIQALWLWLCCFQLCNNA